MEGQYDKNASLYFVGEQQNNSIQSEMKDDFVGFYIIQFFLKKLISEFTIHP